MKHRVPDEIGMKQRANVCPGDFLASPSFNSELIKRDGFCPFRELPLYIFLECVAEVLNRLVAYLHSHALLRKCAQQRFKHQLAAVSPIIAREIGRKPLQFITSDKSSVGP